MAVAGALNPQSIQFGSAYKGFSGSPTASGPKGLSGYQKGAIASSVIGGLTDIATGFINARRTKSAYDFNARMAELKGRMTRLSADVEIKNIRRRSREIYSFQRAAYAAAGVRLSGSPAAVMKESLKQAELDIIYTNISADYGVAQYKTQAGLYRSEGKQAKYKAIVGTGKSLLQFGTSLYQITNPNRRV